MEIKKLHMGAAACALDLGDGSERAEYVNQDYVINRLGRPHRNINIMYTYYPNDKEWPERISVACKDMEIHFQWDYPYDDYFPYGGGTGVATEAEPFAQMRDIRKHGQDVTLTLTIDCKTDDEKLINIAKELKSFGRMRIRINHECAGTWFTHNQRYSYKEIADFFVHFNGIIKEYAPNIQTVFCAGFITDDGKQIECEDDFINAYKAADIWSGDCYLALHYGWPFDVCEKGSESFHTYTVEEFYKRLENTAKRLKEINGGVMKPLVVSEFNTDGDVTGGQKQGESIKEFAKMIKDNKADWFSAFTLYQFRDRGRLGLEIEDPNNAEVGIEQPMLGDYKEVLNDEYFMPSMDVEESAELPFTFRWGSAEDADGLAVKLNFEKNPVFCEVTFEEDLNLMMEINGHWFYKAPGTKTVDLMSAFYNTPIKDNTELEFKMFAPPATGENEDNGAQDWNYNVYTKMNKMPDFRIRYESVKDVKVR